MPTTERVARIHECGPPEVLRFEDIVVGEPGDDEALVRNTVIGLNFVDVYYRRGSLPVPSFPATIGDEAAGVVEAVGKNVKNVSVGEECDRRTTSPGALKQLRGSASALRSDL